MPRTLPFPLITALMMFPQIVETVYSPALPDIAQAFGTSASQAGQTLSIYFFAFAVGVVVWGRLCDRLGRRRAILLGLTTYAGGTLIALVSTTFTMLLLARALSAFGAAAGSVGTQTVLRDRLSGDSLARAFALIGAALAISPALGLLSGAWLVSVGGHRAVFTGLTLLAIVLLIWSLGALPETRRPSTPAVAIPAVMRRMLRDREIWRSVLLIALFNLGLFGFYQLAPFVYASQGYSPQTFGHAGWLMTLGALSGALLNRRLLTQQWCPQRLIQLGATLFLAGALGVASLLDSWWFVVPMALVVVAYGLAIPNLLTLALVRYGDCLGTAGALLGLLYYLVLGGGLLLSATLQRLDLLLMGAAGLSLLLMPTASQGQSGAQSACQAPKAD